MSYKIDVIGDSHSGAFYVDSKIRVNQIGPVLMHTMGDANNPYADDIIALLLKSNAISKDNMWLFVFGEIDVRCHVHPQIHERNRDVKEVINNLAENYINRLKLLHQNIAISSVVPPIDFMPTHGTHEQFPFRGSAMERRDYTHLLNEQLQSLCSQHLIKYVNTWSILKNEEGFLPREDSDDQVHVVNTSKIKKYLVEINLI